MLKGANVVRYSLTFLGASMLAVCSGEAVDPLDRAVSIGGSEAVSGGGTTDVQPEPATLQGTEADWAIVQEKTQWAVAQGHASLSIGDLVARIGETFVGTPYAPYTLEAPGEESLVIELEELDCVTFVENVLALARFVQTAPDDLLAANAGQKQRPFFARILEDIRYRGGELDRYPSRLHYFSEWIRDNHRMGLVRDVSEELGGVPDDEAIDFMTTHSDAYRQLGENPAFVSELRQAETRLNAAPRYYIPEDRIAGVEDHIRDGDIIAATSTVAGLDIAHTGIALWREGRLHLLHAPLVGGVVQISEVPLAERIQRIRGQDGVMVARPMAAMAAR
jgi:hypothetical protein